MTIPPVGQGGPQASGSGVPYPLSSTMSLGELVADMGWYKTQCDNDSSQGSWYHTAGASFFSSMIEELQEPSVVALFYPTGSQPAILSKAEQQVLMGAIVDQLNGFQFGKLTGPSLPSFQSGFNTYAAGVKGSKIGAAINSGGTVSSSDITSDLTNFQSKLITFIGDSFFSSLTNGPSFSDLIHSYNLDGALTWLSGQLANPPSSINFGDPNDPNAVSYEENFTDYFGYTLNPFTTSKSGLFATFSQGSSSAPSASEAAGAFTKYAREIISGGAKVTAQVLDSFANLAKWAGEGHISSFLGALATNFSDTYQGVYPLYFKAIVGGMDYFQANGEYPFQNSSLYSWLGDNVIDNPNNWSVQNFFADGTDPNFPNMSIMSLLIFSVIVRYGDPNTPSGASLIQSLSSELTPAAGSTLPPQTWLEVFLSPSGDFLARVIEESESDPYPTNLDSTPQ